ncbi:MAG TPA: metallophosphoesterase [Bacteroidales bacterium]|nr:metallophosphoesterase [Bacteroidales bacterium]
MRNREVILFILIVITIYFSANSYIFIKGLKALSGQINIRLYILTFLSLAMTFIAGKILERNSSSVVVDILNVTGGFWLAFMLYSTLFLLLSDILRLVIFPAGIMQEDQLGSYRFYSYVVSSGLAVVIIIIGFINSVTPVTRNYSISIDKKVQGDNSVLIAVVSDVHLGSVVRNRSLRVLSRMLKKVEPDFIFFLGDLVDGEINPVIRDDLLKSLTLPIDRSRVYAITGNHEYIGGRTKTLSYLKKHNLNILEDEIALLEPGIQLIGRKDRDSFRYSGERRKDLSELLQATDPEKPIIILDHQPLAANREPEGKFDLMLSGHTHNGQMWPFSYIVNMVYANGYGHSVDGDRQFIVSAGFGTWGPRVRIGSRSEIIVIDLKFGDQ